MTQTATMELTVGEWTLGGARLLARLGPEGWGLEVSWAGHTAAQPLPVRAEVWDGERSVRHSAAYADLVPAPSGLRGHARLDLGADTALSVEDRWTVREGALHLARSVRVEGDAPGGFLTAFTFELTGPRTWPDVDAFAPGMLYGWTEHLAPQAIGSPAHYLMGVRAVRIREDRLPAPLFGLSLRDGSSVAVLNPAPRGDTSRADGLDLEGTPLVDGRFAFAALGGEEVDGHLSLGLWFPGTEGEVTYLADTPFEQGLFGNNVRRRWRGRYHPLQGGFEQRYEASFRLGQGERDQDFRREAWRWAWRTLSPAVEPQDIPAAREALADVLEASLIQVGDRSAPAHVMDAVSGEPHPLLSPLAMMGFTGRAVETGELLLREAVHLEPGRAARRRERALAVLETFARLPVSPPQGEGLNLLSGYPSSGVRPDFYLRALAEGGKAMLRAYEFERGRGTEHPGWLAWCVRLADWLLAQEFAQGGFPRSWRDGSAAVVSADPRSSYAAVPFLVALSRVTGEAKYLASALRAAEMCWALDGSRGYFIGGTLDNANVLDKEAGTLSLEAYLALFGATDDARWLARARDAADFSETWLYLWNVPMPQDEPGADLHWKPGASTVGAQLIATGHSLIDVYMAWDVASYARLWRLTGDAHYLEVARMLLHNTKTMLALPGRSFDLAGPGWQQENWSFAPPRGRGQHRHWLPWVAASQLEGILALEEFGADLARG